MNYNELTPIQKIFIVAEMAKKLNERIDNINHFDNEELCSTFTTHAAAVWPKEGYRMYGIDELLKVCILLGMTTNFGIKDDNGRKCACLTMSPYKED